MLLASVVVHLGAAIGILGHFSPGSFFPQHNASPGTPERMLLIAPERFHGAESLPSSSASASLASSNPSALPVLPNDATSRRGQGVSSPDLAYESKAHPQLREASWDALTPSQAPSLDSRAGIVFVLDISGSMYEPCAGTTRLALARRMLEKCLASLPDGTPFAVTVYGETAQTSGPLVAADATTRRAALAFIAHDFDCGGGTNLPAGLVSAQQVRPGRILVVTDGDLNAPAASLLPAVKSALAGNPALTIVGVRPRGDTDAESLLQGLADQQGGDYLADPGEKILAKLELGKNRAER
jgi:Mg-chelatase subunit ChlD